MGLEKNKASGERKKRQRYIEERVNPRRVTCSNRSKSELFVFPTEENGHMREENHSQWWLDRHSAPAGGLIWGRTHIVWRKGPQIIRRELGEYRGFDLTRRGRDGTKEKLRGGSNRSQVLLALWLHNVDSKKGAKEEKEY